MYSGIEDKLVATDGYGIVVTDEASSFFQEIKGQDIKHDSNIGLLNQLFDGEGDKSTFAGMRQRFVPPNSTSMTLRSPTSAIFQGHSSHRENSMARQWLCRTNFCLQ